MQSFSVFFSFCFITVTFTIVIWCTLVAYTRQNRLVAYYGVDNA